MTLTFNISSIVSYFKFILYGMKKYYIENKYAFSTYFSIYIGN